MSAIIIDAESGNAFEYGHDVLAVVDAATTAFGRWNAKAQALHLDAEGFNKYRRHCDGITIRNWAAQQRNDALTSAVGAFPRELEHIYTEMLTEERRPLNLQTLVQMDGRVPLGARSHTVRRRLGSGDTAIYRGGVEIPVVRGSRVEESFGIIHIVTSVMQSIFEQMSDNFAGRNQFADDTRDAVRFLEERANTIGFEGDAPSNLDGLLNFRHMAKTVSTFAFTAANVAADPAGARAELNRLANFAMENSGGTFRPNRFVTSIRIRNVLMQTQNSDASDRSVGQVWLDGQADINSIEGVHELRGVGPAGQDGLFFYDDQLSSTAFVLVQPPTPLPAHAINALQNQTVYMMTIGGVIMRNVGNNLLAFAAGVALTPA